MLKEWPDLHQRPKERPRRCFTDEHFELYVWYEPDGSPRHIRLLYLLGDGGMRALWWEKGRGSAHYDVYGGEGDGYQYDAGRGVAPSDTELDKKAVGSLFRKASAGLDTGLRKLVLEVIDGHAPEPPPAREKPPARAAPMRVARGPLGREAAKADVLIAASALSAFPSAAYAFIRGARRILLAATAREALGLRREHPDHLLLGGGDGRPFPGFDLPDSPFAVSRERLLERNLILVAPEGVCETLRAAESKHIFAVSFLNAAQTARWMPSLSPDSVVVAASDAEEDAALAGYLAGLLENKAPSVLAAERGIRSSPAAKRYFNRPDSDLTETDLDMCLRADFLPYRFVIEAGSSPPVMTWNY